MGSEPLPAAADPREPFEAPAPWVVGEERYPSVIGQGFSLGDLLFRATSVFTPDEPTARTTATPHDPLLGLPTVAADAYVSAAAWAGRVLPGCGIDAAYLAGIGHVATAHGSRGGGRLLANGDSAMPIRADDGRLGPMLLTPTQWASFAEDGDGDGSTSPDNIYDATRSAAEGLCAMAVALTAETGGGLTTVEAMRRVATAFFEGDAPAASVSYPIDAVHAAVDANEVLEFADNVRGALQSFASVLENADAHVARLIVWLRAQVARGAKYAATNPGRFGTPWDGVAKKSFLSERIYQYPRGTITYDCSGLVVMAYRHVGVDLLALGASWTGAMLAHLPRISRSQVSVGDLIIFGQNGHTTHVVVSLGGDRYIHAGSCGGGDMAVCERVGIDWGRVMGVVRVPLG